MSVLLESQPGETIVCIQEFHASPDGEPFSWETSQTFSAGAKLTLLRGARNPKFPNHPNEWMVVFQNVDGIYFVTADAWHRIGQIFGSNETVEPTSSSATPMLPHSLPERLLRSTER